MGYTHYYSRGTNTSADRWRVFTDEVRAILSHPAIADLVCKEYCTPDLPPHITDKVVQFNGKGEHGHETFVIERRAHRNFCKTGGISQMSYVESWGKHYDVAVCCVLLSARRHLHELVSSDGDWTSEGWMRARALYAKITSQLVPSPWPEKCCSQCRRFFSRDGHNWGGHKVCKVCGKGSYRSGPDGVTDCMECHAKDSFRKAKPLSWCWFCSSGYKSKEDAAAAIEKMWNEITESLKKYGERR